MHSIVIFEYFSIFSAITIFSIALIKNCCSQFFQNTMAYIYNRPIQQTAAPAPAAAPRAFQSRQTCPPNGYYYPPTAPPPQVPPTFTQQTYVMQPAPQQFQMVQFPTAPQAQPIYYPSEEALYTGQQIPIGIPPQTHQPPPQQQPFRYNPPPPPAPRPQPQAISPPTMDIRKRRKEVSAVTHQTSIPQTAQIYTQQAVPKRQVSLAPQNPIYPQTTIQPQPIQQPAQPQQALQIQDMESLQQRSLENYIPKVSPGFPTNEFPTPPGCFNIIKRGNLPGLSFSQIIM